MLIRDTYLLVVEQRKADMRRVEMELDEADEMVRIASLTLCTLKY